MPEVSQNASRILGNVGKLIVMMIHLSFTSSSNIIKVTEILKPLMMALPQRTSH
ncbi:hypothetical protein [Pseudanabaena minima]|uniref:hypothetical protein n=1 Tax=Pseudanabaena minima TaxID=890415 RepID=UPI003DA96015